MILRRPFLAGAAVVLAASSLQAQSRDTTRLGDLVVTATRAPWNAGAVPAATTVLRGDDLRARGIAFVKDALAEVPGMTLVQSGSWGAVTSVFLRGGESDYVKVLLDGVPLNQPGGSINLADLTTDDLDRIEVVRGPVSVLYGADAMSGVVQLFTRRGAGQVHGTVAGQGGTFGSRAGQARLAGSTGAWSVSAAGSTFRTDGVYDFNSNYRDDVGSVRVGYDGGRAGRAAFTARVGDGEAHYPTDFTGTPVDHNQRTRNKTSVFGLELGRGFGERVTGTVQGYASRLDAAFRNRPDTPADTNGYGYDADRDGITWRRGVDARADIAITPSARVSVGGGFEREHEEQTSRTAQNYGTGAFTETAEFAAKRTTHDVYAQLLAAPVRALSLQLGARLDDNSAFGSFGTWRAGASYTLTGTTRLYAAAGTAFKAPTFSELFAAGAFEVGNPALEPERSRNVEGGIEQALASGRVTLRATAFSQTFRDLIQYVGAATPGDPTYTNIGRVRSRGVEAALVVTPVAAVAVRAHWTWLKTEVTDTGAASSVVYTQGQRLLRRPASSGGVTATWLVRGVTLGATATYVGERDDRDDRNFPSVRVTLPSYTTVDLSLDAPIRRAGRGLPGLDLTVRAENVFDADYDQAMGYPGRGRTLFGGARLQF